MTDTLSPIDLALQAVGDLFFRPPLKYKNYKAYIDDSPYSLNQLPERMSKKSPDERSNEDSNPDAPTELAQPTSQISRTSSQQEKEDHSREPSTLEVPVLIRMGTKAAKNQKPYAEVLGQFLKEKNFGISGSVHSIVSDLLQYQQLGNKSKLPEGLDLSKLKIENTEITEKEKFEEAFQRLLQWAKIESCLASPSTPFCRLAGGIRPIVYVFDDYNNFLNENDPNKIQPANNNQIYTVSAKYSEISKEDKDYKKIEEYYKQGSSSQAKTLYQALDGFYLCLNNLALAFDIQAPDMRFTGGLDNRYQEVARLLNFQKLDQQRNQISAFIVDLEWLPCPEWILKIPTSSSLKSDEEHMGNIAVRLLTQRYPEIPCFIFTGMWSIETLQKSLAAGAAWCFQKPVSHHPGNSSNPEEELNYFNLEQHLTEFAQRNYGSYNYLPNPQQFNIAHDPQLIEKLQAAIKEKGMEIDFSNEKCINTQNFRGLVAKQFTSENVLPIKLLTGGLSGALATFFARGVDNGKTNATRFMKIDSWLDIQKEYFSYQHIIRPALNNHVAHIIQPPAVTPAQIKGKLYPLYGAILSSLAGFPEDYSKLRSFEELIDEYLYGKGSEDVLLNKLKSTLEYLLFPIYQSSKERLFHSADHLLPSYTGSLVSINDSNTEVIPVSTNLKGRIGDHLGRRIKLKGCYLDRVKFKDSILIIKDSESGATVELSPKKPSPQQENENLSIDQSKLESLPQPTELIYRKDFNGLDKEKLENRFGALWARLGMNVEIVIDIDSENTAVKKYYEKIEAASKHPSVKDLLDSWKETLEIQEDVKDPFDIVKYGFEFKGLSGTIHGDLNLNNILCPEGEQVGFLIDFPKARKDGLIAFDLAWLEVRIWRYYLIPNIISLAALFSNSKEISYKMLHSALKSSDFAGDSSKLFNSFADHDKEYGYIGSELLAPISNSLKIISTIREFSRQKLSISIKEKQMRYGLGVSFLNNCKYAVKTKNYFNDPEEINVLSYLAASYYLSELIQDTQSSDQIGN
jgi:Ternary complex associated domain 9